MDKRIRILLIEDNPGDVRLIQEMLDQAVQDGYQVECADRLSKGLECLVKGGIDVVLLDLGLPDSQGLDTFGKVHAQAPAVPIVLLTGLDDAMLAIQAVRQGAQDYLVKGDVDSKLLRHALHYAVERKRVEEALRDSEEYYRSIIENSFDAIAIVSGDGTIRYEGPSFERVFGYRPEDHIGKGILDFVHPDDMPKAADAFTQMLQNPGATLLEEMRIRHKDGSWRTFEVVGRNLLDNAVIAGIVVNLHDITERKRVEEELRESARRIKELSLVDDLTGLHNRRHFYQTLESEQHRTKRYGRSFSLAMLDLDGFKEYNDRFGHASGDGVLQSFAQTLKAALRKSDISFRYGGDEFTVILPATDTNRAKQIIERTRAKWLQTAEAQYPAVEPPIGFSAGIAQFPEDAETGDGLVFLADSALYFAKREGGYRAVLVSDLSTIPPDVLSTATLDQVYALAATVDARDPFTYGHSGRVAEITQTIGKTIGLAEKELADLYAASLLHDVGKVGVPDAVLTKPDVLTEEEWEIIKKHSAEGARIAGYIKGLGAVVPLILHHHEWYDGTGYPDGLKGEEIPLGARIICVADAYDTMTTARPYREVVSQQEALEELRRCSGTQFDPELVEAFCRAMTEDKGQD